MRVMNRMCVRAGAGTCGVVCGRAFAGARTCM